MSDPKHMDPNDVVKERIMLPVTAELQHPLSSGENHQVPTTPATET